MWKDNATGDYYFGDCRVGDREATPEEVAAWEAQRSAPVIPTSVSRFQARAALLLAGLLDDVETLMAAPDTPALAKLAWADAQEFERQSPTIAALAGAVGLTEQDIDALFVTAAGIKA